MTENHRIKYQIVPYKFSSNTTVLIRKYSHVELPNFHKYASRQCGTCFHWRRPSWTNRVYFVGYQIRPIGGALPFLLSLSHPATNTALYSAHFQQAAERGLDNAGYLFCVVWVCFLGSQSKVHVKELG